MKKSIYCPICESELSVTHRDHYEDLSEHVCNPNGTPSLKDGYQCINPECDAHKFNITWIEDGDMFIGNKPSGVTYSQVMDLFKKSVSGMNFALNSWNHYYELGKNNIEKRTIKIPLGKYRLNIKPKPKGGNGIDEYQPSWFKWSFEWWRKEGNSLYVNIIPDYRMVKFCIDRFNHNFEIWERTQSNRSHEQCLKQIMCMTAWNTPDDRRYSKIASYRKSTE